MPKKLIITLVRSTIGRPQNQRRTVESLGLRKIRQSVEQLDTPDIRGKIGKVSHLVEVKEIEG